VLREEVDVSRCRQAKRRTVRSRTHPMKTGRLPHCSLKGAHSNGPSAKPYISVRACQWNHSRERGEVAGGTHEDEKGEAERDDHDGLLKVDEQVLQAARVDGRAKRDAECRDGRVGGDEPA